MKQRQSFLFHITVLLCIFCISSLTQAIPRDRTYIRDAKKLTIEEATEYLISIRNLSYNQDYVFRFKLKHYPPRSRTVIYNGTWYGHTDSLTGDHYDRIVIENKNTSYSESAENVADILLKRGLQSQAWKATNTDGVKTFEIVQIKQLEEPIINDITLTYFDLLAPYIYWNQFNYIGPSQVKARPSQTFQFLSAEPTSSIHSVKVSLDNEFRAPLKTTSMGKNKEPISSMELISLKKTSGQSIPKTIDYRNHQKKGNKSRIDIIAAAMDKPLPIEIFQPENLAEEFPKLDHFVFDVF